MEQRIVQKSRRKEMSKNHKPIQTKNMDVTDLSRNFHPPRKAELSVIIS